MNSSRLDLPKEKQLQRQQELENLVRRIPQVVSELQLDAVLIPGDLWDHETMGGAHPLQFTTLYQALCEMKPVPVVISPGNHDFYSPVSLYHADALRAKGFEPWPEHIRIFSEPRFQTISLPLGESHVRITGRAFQDNTLIHPDQREQVHTRLLQQLPPCQPSDSIEILLFHGARDDANRFDEKMTAPFSRQELLSLHFDYAAAGHYHRHDRFTDEEGRIRGAYAGSPFARGLDETGPKFALIVEVLKEGHQPATIRIEKLPMDSRKIVHREVLLHGAQSTEEIESLILANLAPFIQAQDILYCELKGQIPPGIPMPWFHQVENILIDKLELFHAKVDSSKVTLAYDINQLERDPHSLEGRYIREIQRKQDTAATPREKELLERALYLGLDAMIQRGVRAP